MSPWLLRRVIRKYEYTHWFTLRKQGFSVNEVLWDLVKHIENYGYNLGYDCMRDY